MIVVSVTNVPNWNFVEFAIRLVTNMVKQIARIPVKGQGKNFTINQAVVFVRKCQKYKYTNKKSTKKIMIFKFDINSNNQRSFIIKKRYN